MERDFMGLAVKQEIPDEVIDAAPVRSLAMQWSFSNKGSAPPHQLYSFQGAQDQRLRTGFDSLASTGLVTITTSETFENDHNSYHSSMQKDAVLENQGGVRYSMTNYPPQHHDGHNIHRPINSHSNRTVSPTASSAMHQSFIVSSGQNLISSVMTNPVPPMPSGSPLVGTTDLRSGTKISGAPAQLTIFYNGSVCVYDNISSEKAQAIMLLAGNGPPMIPSTTPPAAPVQASKPMSSVLDGFVVSQPYSTMPIHSSHGPMTSVTVSHTAGRSGNNNDATTFKPTGIFGSCSNTAGRSGNNNDATTFRPTGIFGSCSNIAGRSGNNNDATTYRPTGIFGSCSNNAEPPKVVNPIRSVPPTFNIPSDTVPQFRKKSLARFLEKRKERVISTSPYGERQSQDYSIPGARTTTLSVNSSGSCPAQAAS